LYNVALMAFCHLMAAPRGGMDEPPPAALAHLRWVWNRIGDGEAFTPEAAFWFAFTAARLPRPIFAAGNPPLPVDWRDRVASVLVGQQVYDPKIRGFKWGGDEGGMRPTAFAVLALTSVSGN